MSEGRVKEGKEKGISFYDKYPLDIFQVKEL